MVSQSKNMVRVMRFILIGTLNALITVLIVWLMMDKLDCNYIATNITAYVIAQINNFFWSKYGYSLPVPVSSAARFPFS